MCGDYISIANVAREYEENLVTAYANLWDTLLDGDDGISEQGYNMLVEIGNLIDPHFVKNVSRFVDATDGRFYISTRSNN